MFLFYLPFVQFGFGLFAVLRFAFGLFTVLQFAFELFAVLQFAFGLFTALHFAFGLFTALHFAFGLFTALHFAFTSQASPHTEPIRVIRMIRVSLLQFAICRRRRRCHCRCRCHSTTLPTYPAHRTKPASAVYPRLTSVSCAFAPYARLFITFPAPLTWKRHSTQI
ncbi:MAG: hypothetical protein ABJB66_00925 [Gemmatimonadaceae bacterium]